MREGREGRERRSREVEGGKLEWKLRWERGKKENRRGGRAKGGKGREEGEGFMGKGRRGNVEKGRTGEICNEKWQSWINETCFKYIGNILFNSRYCSSVMLI